MGSEGKKQGVKRRVVNRFAEGAEGAFEVAFRGHARRAYLWVLLIFSPLPLAAVASLVFGLLEGMAWHLAAIAALQAALSTFAVLSMRARIAYVFEPSSGLISYRRIVLRRERKRAFANARNFRHLFVASQVVGRARRYLIFQLRAIHVDGRLVNLSGYETGLPDELNAIGAEVAKRLELPFVPAERNKVSRILKKVGKTVEWAVENVHPA